MSKPIFAIRINSRSDFYEDIQNKLSQRFYDYHILVINDYTLKEGEVKELLIENKMNLNEIAFELGYSSSAHLSRQFKQFADISPLQYKNELRVELQMCG